MIIPKLLPHDVHGGNFTALYYHAATCVHGGNFTILYYHTAVGVHGGNFTLPHSTVTLQLVCMGATLLYRTLLSHYSWCAQGQLYFTTLYCHSTVGAQGQLYFTPLYCHTTVGVHGVNFTLPHSTIMLQLVCMGSTLLYRTLLSHCSTGITCKFFFQN